MNIKQLNRILGSVYSILGIAKLLLYIFLLIWLITQLNSISHNVEPDDNIMMYAPLALAINITQIILLGASFIMGILNMKDDTETAIQYLIGFIAILLQLMVTGLIAMFFYFIQCSVFVKVGVKIRKNNLDYSIGNSSNNIKETEWFFRENNDSNYQIDDKTQKRINKLNTELAEWKKLLDDGQIDELSYNDEIGKINKKISKLEHR